MKVQRSSVMKTSMGPIQSKWMNVEIIQMSQKIPLIIISNPLFHRTMRPRFWTINSVQIRIKTRNLSKISTLCHLKPTWLLWVKRGCLDKWTNIMITLMPRSNCSTLSIPLASRTDTPTMPLCLVSSKRDQRGTSLKGPTSAGLLEVKGYPSSADRVINTVKIYHPDKDSRWTGRLRGRSLIRVWCLMILVLEVSTMIKMILFQWEIENCYKHRSDLTIAVIQLPKQLLVILCRLITWIEPVTFQAIWRVATSKT